MTTSNYSWNGNCKSHSFFAHLKNSHSHRRSRHGKFRPTLMNLVTANDSSATKTTIKQAIQTYRGASSSPADDKLPSAAVIAAALATLTKLRGIGPATASLLLTVHDPERVIFFSDEAFYWLCCGGKDSTIKYNNKEYVLLREKATELVERLDVPATDVEKVAYVLMKQGKTAQVKETAAPSKPQKPAPVKAQTAKRKSTASQETDKPTPASAAAGVRRSKRVKS